MGDRATGSGRRDQALWAVSVAVVPLLLAAVAQFWPRPQIEEDLTSRSVAALQVAGFTGARVSFDGRDAVLAGVPADREADALDVVEGIDGVRDVSLAPSPAVEPVPPALPESTPAPSAAPAAAPTSVSVAAAGEPVVVRWVGDRVTVQAIAPDETTKAQLLAAASAGAARPVADDVTVASGATLPGEPAVLRALVAALGDSSGDRALRWASDGVTLTGTAPLPDDIATIEQQVRAAAPGVAVTSELALPPVDKAAVQAALAALVVSFRPDSTDFTPEGEQGVRLAADILRAAPGARVEVAGHVGRAPGTAEVAQRLSDDRAARARDALIAAGVPADALVTRGYGDTRPRGDRAASRRVEFIVL